MPHALQEVREILVDPAVLQEIDSTGITFIDSGEFLEDIRKTQFRPVCSLYNNEQIFHIAHNSNK